MPSSPELHGHTISGTTVAFSAINNRTAHQIGEFVRRSAVPTNDACSEQPVTRRLFLLGVERSPSVTKMMDELLDAGFFVAACNQVAGRYLKPADATGGIVVVVPTRWGIVALATTLGFNWPGIETDLDTFSGVAGTDRNARSAHGRAMDEFFSLVPAPDSPGFIDILAEGAPLFLSTTRQAGPSLAMDRTEFGHWIRRRRLEMAG
jgi:hypothetical protein